MKLKKLLQNNKDQLVYIVQLKKVQHIIIIIIMILLMKMNLI